MFKKGDFLLFKKNGIDRHYGIPFGGWQTPDGKYLYRVEDVCRFKGSWSGKADGLLFINYLVDDVVHSAVIEYRPEIKRMNLAPAHFDRYNPIEDYYEDHE